MKLKFPKLKMIWAIIRGRTVIYNAEIDMIKNVVQLDGVGGCVVNCKITFNEGGGKIVG